jgi:uncharacterized repeat protein (TIGR02543 family)
VADTPFAFELGTTKIVSIQFKDSDGYDISRQGSTICLDGADSDRLYRFDPESGWVELPGRTYENGQVCGTTNLYLSLIVAAPEASAPVINQESSVTWNDQGATTASSGGSTSYTNGSSVTAIPTTAPQKNGHTFVGWFTSPSSGRQITNGSYTPASPYADLTFYAQWSAIGPALDANDASLSATEAAAAAEAARAGAAEAARVAAAEAARVAAAEAAVAQREAEKQSARAEITCKLESIKDLSVDSFAKAAIPGITSTNIADVKAEILALPEAACTDINQVLKVARKFEVVGYIASNSIKNLPSSLFVEIGLIPATSKNKVTLAAAIRKLPASARDTYAEIKAVIDAAAKSIQARKDRLAAIIARNASRNSK